MSRVQLIARVSLSLSLSLSVAGAIAAGACRRTEPPAAGGAAREPMARGSGGETGPVAGGSGSATSGASASASAGAGTGTTAGTAAVGADPAAAAAAGAAAPGPCTALTFAESTPVPEASGAAWLSIDGALRLVVISDSGNDGAYAIVDPDTGDTREQGKLPLGGPGEDLEGITARDGKLFVITSPGWIRVYERKGRGFALVDGPYPLGPINLSGGSRFGNVPPTGTGMVCDATRTNCGRNYEGLCLAPRTPASSAGSAGSAAPASRCVGFAAAKADGHLYCVVERAGKLAVEYAGGIPISRPGAVSDCAFSADGRLYVGTNLFDAANVYRVTGWEDPSRAKVTVLEPLPAGFPETLAVRGDLFYVMSDAGGAPSLMKRFRCPGR